MTKRLTKYHVAHILALIVLIVLGVFFSPNVTALSDSKTYSMSAGILYFTFLAQ